eukprot:3571747-Pyramimonas_sp.AAC.1
MLCASFPDVARMFNHAKAFRSWGPDDWAILRAVLSDLESQSDCAHTARRRFAAAGRHVDDVIMGSKLRCSACFKCMVYIM